MAEVDITSMNERGTTSWIRLYFRNPKSSQKYDEKLFFERTYLSKTKKFVAKMDDCSSKCAKYKREKNPKKLSYINKITKKRLENYGMKLFDVLKKTQNVPIRNFQDIFGEDYSTVTLTLDKNTRRYPWELLHDGTDFLATKYPIGRTILMSNAAQRLSGFSPLNNKALIVGLNYRWSPKDQLETPESEALQVERRLGKLGYDSTVLRAKDATVKAVKKALSDGVSIFHFTGHGNYYKNQPEGKKGRLSLYGGDLTEEDLRQCFNKAKGAPYFSFLNACRSAKEIYNSHIMDAFLDYGAENFIGNIWSVYDQPSRNISIKFYDEAINGQTFGNSLMYSRWQQKDSRRITEITTWPAMVLYGPPNNTLPTAP